MSAETSEYLKGEVERVFGRRILNASDCQSLSNDILHHTKQQVSLNTLRRFFGLMTSKYQPSNFTLHLLSKYCGFNSFAELMEHRQRTGNNDSHSYSDLLNFLILLFRDLDTKGVEDITYINLIQQVINNLEKWPQVIDDFQNQIAKTENGQLFYYEQFANIDKLSSYYGDGLRYYLHERSDPQAQIFGHSLLCFRGWLTMQKEEVHQHCREVIKYRPAYTIHPGICARYFASQLFQLEVLQLEAESVLSAARDFYTDVKFAGSANKGFPYFELTLSEALILTRHYDEALYYINEAIKKKNNYMPPYVDIKLFESLSLFQAIALNNTGKTTRAKEMMEKISIRNFSFLSKKFNLILFLTQKHSSRSKELFTNQLDYLVKQTGFKKLVSAFPETIFTGDEKQEL